ncbi:uncharacterized protein IUM83_02254 [Phytophthora cinnamomi]|uniref:uncharacterized protein n=1 Tax=Phytophthora cinnamomi TaxID=4785 RepID=UPI003559B1FF|nr:hypothetical protein IUM83_02254 [Phytophthora cinnamomi]
MMARPSSSVKIQALPQQRWQLSDWRPSNAAFQGWFCQLQKPAGKGLPLERGFAASSTPTPPAHWQAPPDHTPDEAFCFDGILARMEHINRSRYVREGYAGIEVLAAMEGLSATDSTDLNDLVGEADDTRWELASLFVVYEPQDFVQRTFSMTTFMRRLLIKYRLTRDEVQTLGSSAWEAICKDQQATADATVERYRFDFNRLLEEQETEKRSLRDQVAKMERQLRTAGLVADSLEARSLNVDRAMTVLNCHQTQVTGNCHRLEGRLKQHKASAFLLSEWKTLINATSADDLFANPVPYVAKSGGDTDTEENGDGGSEPDGDGTGSHGRRTAFLDLTGDPSSGDSSHEEPQPKKADQDRKAPDFIQLAMGSGLSYLARMNLLESRNSARAPFKANDLSNMLARMPFWNKLDEADWACLVPEICYLAENVLDQCKQDHPHPELWPDLVDPTQSDGDVLLLRSDDEDEVDNETQDATWTPSKKTQAKIAQMERCETEVEVGGQGEEAQDDEEEKAPSTPTRRSKRKLDSASSQPDSAPGTPRTKKKQKARPGEPRRQSLLARKTLSELTPEEMATIAVPGPGINSWRHHGILNTFAPSTPHAIDQSPYFSDYAPSKNGGSGPLIKRYDSSEYTAVVLQNTQISSDVDLQHKPQQSPS